MSTAAHKEYTPADIERIEPIIGMEIHVELATRSKMFSRAPNPAHRDNQDAAPNTLLDPLILALPGTLPVMNAQAVEMAVRVGLALGCSIAAVSKWDRKSYFYPDLPKAYQISQYDLPLCFDGRFEVPALDDKGRFDLSQPTTHISILRAHLEEDAGKLLHEAPGGRPIKGSIVDLNRAGTPLLEIVTQPEFVSPTQCVSFARLLRLACCHLGVTQGVMQRGHMRFEPNINCKLVLRDGRLITTPIVEIKNLNSFRALLGAIEYELAAQPKRWLEDGYEMGPGQKTTRGWDADREITFIQRSKEDAHDYRYFPDPDLLPVHIQESHIQAVRETLPELPLDRLKRFVLDEELSISDASLLIEDRAVCDFFESVVDLLVEEGAFRPTASKAAANLLIQIGLKIAQERHVTLPELAITAKQCASIVQLRDEDAIGADAMAELFAHCCAPGNAKADVRELAKEHNLILVRDDAQLDAWCAQVIADQPEVAAQVSQGKVQAVGRLIGAVRALSEGKADAKAVREKLLEKLT